MSRTDQIYDKPPLSLDGMIAVLEYILRKVAPDTGWGRKVKDLRPAAFGGRLQAL